MCEYCGCQQVGVIAQLTDEHERLRNLGHELARAANEGDFDAARPLAAEMQELLGPHTQVEEQGLFPALAGEFGPQLAELVDEHRSIDAALDALARPTPSSTWRQTTRSALAHLFDHILKEQDGVFPAALATLAPAEWEALEAVRSRVGSAAAFASPAG